MVQIAASVLAMISVTVSLIIEQSQVKHDGYFWLEMHCLATSGLIMYGRIADAR